MTDRSTAQSPATIDATADDAAHGRLDHDGALATRPREDGRLLAAASLLDLPRLDGDDARLVVRQALTALARASAEEGPSPFEGVRPEALAAAVGKALEMGLLDDLDWLGKGAAGAALYQLASGLPTGNEQREIGRRVLARMLAADARTFTAMATPMARSGGKGLSSPGVLARLGLVIELPLSTDVADGPLALAIASRRQLARDLLIARSTRSLGDRRFVARIIERAAREAVRRAGRDDRTALRLVGPEGPLDAVWSRLLGDREPLVWRHIAIARGILLPFSESGTSSLDREFAPSLSPTEWRRAAASIGGIAATHPELATSHARRALEGGLLARDKGAIAPFLWGLARAAESEPEAALELFSMVESGLPEDLADAVVWLGRELGPCDFIDAIRPRALARLEAAPSASSHDDGAVALRAQLLRELSGEVPDDDPLTLHLERALEAFASQGAREAHELGATMLQASEAAVSTLAAIGDERIGGSARGLARRASLSVVRDLDLAVLEHPTLDHLLRLEGRSDRARSLERQLESMREHVFGWLLEREMRPPSDPERPHLVLHFSRLRALLHLVDSDAASADDDANPTASFDRWRSAARSLVACLGSNPLPPLRRALMATFARSLDALARAGECDASDALLVAAATLGAAGDLETLSEATMGPEVRRLLLKTATVVRAMGIGEPRLSSPSLTGVGLDSLLPPPNGDPSDESPALSLATIRALEALAEELAQVGSGRSDALRAVVVRFATALSAMRSTRSLRELGSAGAGESDPVILLENAIAALGLIYAGARARIVDEGSGAASSRFAAARALSSTIARLTSGAVSEISEEVASEIARSVGEGLPGIFRLLAADAARTVLRLPLEGTVSTGHARADLGRAELPPWVPLRRVLGGFFVERPLGAGAVGSVFVVTRVEDRNDATAERFALKVPDFNENASRHLSEEQFLSLFRSEASALMSVPSHSNLARFVTFDLAARPKPILVMELVEGPNLESIVDAGTLDSRRAVRALLEVLAGLEAMHSVGVGHLDLKPANVVLRRAEQAVLVDFGLAGRNIRPGCGSAPYAPPEVWTPASFGSAVTPMAADVYSFACLAFEALTGALLFQGETEMQLIAQHMAHDGLPPRLRAVASDPRASLLSELLFSALRRNPKDRLPIGELRQGFARLAGRLEAGPWPIVPQRLVANGP